MSFSKLKIGKICQLPCNFCSSTSKVKFLKAYPGTALVQMRTSDQVDLYIYVLSLYYSEKILWKSDLFLATGQVDMTDYRCESRTAPLSSFILTLLCSYFFSQGGDPGGVCNVGEADEASVRRGGAAGHELPVPGTAERAAVYLARWCYCEAMKPLSERPSRHNCFRSNAWNGLCLGKHVLSASRLLVTFLFKFTGKDGYKDYSCDPVWFPLFVSHLCCMFHRL